MTNEEKLKELEGMLPTVKAGAEEAIARAEAAEAKLSKAEKEYEFSQRWLKTIEESNKREQERKAEEYAKAVEAAEWRRQQNEAARAEERKWNNMTPQELEAEREKCRKGLAELAAQREQYMQHLFIHWANNTNIYKPRIISLTFKKLHCFFTFFHNISYCQDYDILSLVNHFTLSKFYRSIIFR